MGIDRMDGLLNLQLIHTAEMARYASGCLTESYTANIPPCLTSELDTGEFGNSKPHPGLLGVLNVKYFVSQRDYTHPHLEPVFVNGENTIYKNTRFLPRAFIVEMIKQVAPDENVFNALRTIDLQKTVLIEKDMGFPELHDTPLQWKINIKNHKPGKIQLEVSSSRQALLVYSESWAPGWQATINSSTTDIYRVDGALLGIIVPQGSSTIHFEYSPLSWRIGWPISLISLLTLSLWACFFLIKQMIRSGSSISTEATIG